MADFCQNGVITTLQKLKERPIEEIEKELKAISRKRKMVLMLPALVTEFDGPAMHRIIDELKGVDYLDRIVLSLDRADAGRFGRIRKIMSILPSRSAETTASSTVRSVMPWRSCEALRRDSDR